MAVTNIVNAGELNQKIKIQKRTKVRNSLGEEISSYITYREVWAKVQQALSYNDNTELKENYKEKTKQTLLFEIRYLSLINNDMRIQYKGEYYNILNVDNVFGTNKKLIIKAEYFEW